jgi:hypothetical protein
MNTTAEIATPDPSNISVNPSASEAESSSDNFASPRLCVSDAPEIDNGVHPGFGTGRRPNGKVGRLPKTLRDQLNQMILDGVSYPDIIARLGDAGKDLKPDNISQWKKRGYQDWLLYHEWLEDISCKSEFSNDILAAPDSISMHQAGLRVAASQMFDQLRLFKAKSDGEASISSQPEKFARLVNALSRLSREALVFKKYEDARQKEQQHAVALPQLDENRDLNENEENLIQDRWDRAFKIHPNHLRSKTPITGPRSSSSSTVPQVSKPAVSQASQPAELSPVDQHTQSTTIDSSDCATEIRVDSRSFAVEKTSPLLPSLPSVESAPPVPSTPAFPISVQPRPSAIKNPSSSSFENQGETDLRPKIENSPETCLSCNTPLPPLLPNGERPDSWCPKCGTSLYDPGTRHLFCPHCTVGIKQLFVDGIRKSDKCPECFGQLPPCERNTDELSHAE